jgi:hypothetical protein
MNIISKRFLPILLLSSLLFSCSQEKVNLREYLSFAFCQPLIISNYLLAFSDNKNKLSETIDSLIMSKNKNDYIYFNNHKKKNANNIFLFKQQLTTKIVSDNVFELTVNGFYHRIKLTLDSILIIPDSSNCPKNAYCEYKSNLLWNLNETKGLLTFLSFEDILIGKKKLKNCMKIKWHTKNGFIFIWLNKKYGIVKTYSKNDIYYSVNLLADIFMKKEEISSLEIPMSM